MCFFFFNDTATTEIYTLSLHDALPISPGALSSKPVPSRTNDSSRPALSRSADRKSTRLNSSHLVISYAVFCLKKKKVSTRRVPRRVEDKIPRWTNFLNLPYESVSLLKH